MVSIAPDRPEPAGITVADLVALVVGAAVAVALPWPFWAQFFRPAAVWTWPRDYQALLAGLQFTTLALSRACMALVPVVLARRARYGGVARPAEFLAAAGGLPPLPRSADHLLFTLWVGFDPWASSTSKLNLTDEELLHRIEQWNYWQDEMFWPWTLGMLAVASLAVLVLALGRRRWPGWLQTALLLLAWLGFSRGVWAIGANVFSLEKALNANAAGRVLYAVGFSAACLVPFKLFFDVPAGAAWHRLRSARAPRPTWLEWLALGLVATLFVASYPPYFFTSYPPGFWAWKWGFLPTTVVAVVLGLMLARRLLTGWSGRDAAV
jgi:hypothetical protein